MHPECHSQARVAFWPLVKPLGLFAVQVNKVARLD